MPKGTLSFNLPEEEIEFQTAQKGGAFKSVVWDLDQYLRNKVKHGEMPEPVREAYEDARTNLHQFLNENEVEI